MAFIWGFRNMHADGVYTSLDEWTMVQLMTAEPNKAMSFGIGYGKQTAAANIELLLIPDEHMCFFGVYDYLDVNEARARGPPEDYQGALPANWEPGLPC